MSLKGYSFSLQTPLKVKTIHKARLQGQFQSITKRVEEKKKALDGLTNEGQRVNLKIESLAFEGVVAASLKEYYTYLKLVQDEILQQESEYRRLLDERMDLQKALIQVLNEIDMLEKLKDKQYREYMDEIEKRSQRELDETINYKTFIQGGMIYG